MATSAKNPTKVFLTGATGYIGGSLLMKLLEPSQAGKWDITVLTRSENTIAKFKELGVTPLLASLDDSDILTKAASDADVVLHLAHADHLPAAKAIVKGCSSGGKRRILIHTSGTGVLIDDARGEYTGEKIYSDLDIEAIHNIPVTQIHRDVDSYIFDNSQGFESIIVAPPVIYGLGTGPFHRHSILIPAMIKVALKYGQAVTVGKGLNVWNYVHIKDLADFYLLLLEKALEGKASTGRDGWYFCESGEVYFKDLAAKIGQVLFKKGALKNEDVVHFNPDESEKHIGPIWGVLGTNSRGKSDRARALGWKPDDKRENILDTIEEEAEIILTAKKGE